MSDYLAKVLASVSPTILYPSDYERIAKEARWYISQEIKAVRDTRTEEYVAAGEFWQGRLGGMDASARIAELGLERVVEEDY